MSSKKSKPYTAPGYGTASPSPPDKPKSTKNDDIYNYTSGSSGLSDPLYQSGSMFHTKNGRIFLVLLIIGLSLMFILAFAFCLVGAIQKQAPRYFALIINMILSSVVTGALIFFLYRGILVSSMIWYLFVQCTFLFFQFITTDIFAWFADKGLQPQPIPGTPYNPALNCTKGSPHPPHNNCTNATNISGAMHRI